MTFSGLKSADEQNLNDFFFPPALRSLDGEPILRKRPGAQLRWRSPSLTAGEQPGCFAIAAPPKGL
jgi:hypothetical protein